ncbi:MAG: gliding motility protein GldC [Bacteroidetes bacterium]|nr:gliding motility protein GldC [Bacteroidota bacterium]
MNITQKKMTITKLMSTKKSSIQITIQMDERNIPEQIQWLSEDQTIPSAQDAKAMMLALWDKQSRNGLSVDLWTKEMTIEEMNLFVFQTLMTMSDTFERATRNTKQAQAIRTFAGDFMKVLQEEAPKS